MCTMMSSCFCERWCLILDFASLFRLRSTLAAELPNDVARDIAPSTNMFDDCERCPKMHGEDLCLGQNERNCNS